MKFFFGLSIFLLSLALTIQSVANEPTHEAAAKSEKHERDNTTLFPPKQANKQLTTRPSHPNLVSPAAMTEIKAESVTLNWSTVEGADAYHLQVATDPNFKWLTADENLFKGTAYELKALEPQKHYYWRVAAIQTANDAGYIKGDFSKSMFATAKK